MTGNVPTEDGRGHRGANSHDGDHPAWSIGPVEVESAEAAGMLREYFTDIVNRYHQREASAYEIDQAMADEPGLALDPPRGAFLLARCNGAAAGCVGVRLLQPRVAEIKRMFVGL